MGGRTQMACSMLLKGPAFAFQKSWLCCTCSCDCHNVWLPDLCIDCDTPNAIQSPCNPNHSPSTPLLSPAQLRGQANPFIAAYEGSRSRAQRSRSQALAEGSRLGPRGSLASSSSSQSELPSAQDLAAALRARGSSSNLTGTLGAAPAASASAVPAAAAGEGGAGAASALLAAMAAMDLPQPTPALPAEVAVARIHYAPAARMLAVVLADGRCALCRTADSGIHPVEQLQLFRWVHKPAGPAAPAVVATALNPTAQLLALGMSHGRVAIYTMQSLLAHGRQLSHPSGSNPQHQRGGSGQFGSFGSSGALAGSSGGGGAGQPEPVRVLSLADWGFRSSVVGAATQLQWSPDGRVLAVGYALRGMAVWTPSGCRIMCSLRQAVATAMPGGNSLAGGPAAQLDAGTPTHRSGGGSPFTAADGSSTAAAGSAAVLPAGQQGQQGQQQRSSTDSASGALGSPGRKAAAGTASGGALEQGVLEVSVRCLSLPAHVPTLNVATRSAVPLAVQRLLATATSQLTYFPLQWSCAGRDNWSGLVSPWLPAACGRSWQGAATSLDMQTYGALTSLLVYVRGQPSTELLPAHIHPIWPGYRCTAVVPMMLTLYYQLQGCCLHQLGFARQVHGGHRAAAAAAPGGGQEEVQALQVGNRCSRGVVEGTLSCCGAVQGCHTSMSMGS